MNKDNMQNQEKKDSFSADAANEQSNHPSISQPHIDRAEGPFEHSGETSGWTKQEKEEKEQHENDQPS